MKFGSTGLLPKRTTSQFIEGRGNRGSTTSHHFRPISIMDNSSIYAMLSIERGVTQHQLRHIDQSVFTIGSGMDCDLVLGDHQFPEFFAYILTNRHEHLLRVLVPNPVLTVNSQDIVVAELADGDRIRCGPYEFHFLQQAATESSSPNVSGNSLAENWLVTDGPTQAGLAASRKLIAQIRSSIEDNRVDSTSHFKKSA